MRGHVAHRGWALWVTALLVFLGASMTCTRRARADGVDVPIALQVGLLRRIATYDRTLPTRAAGTLHVLIVAHHGNALSERVAGQLDAQVRAAAPIAGLPVEIARHTYSGTASLLAAVASTHASIVYFGPGMSNDLPGLATALAGREVLTVSSVGTDADVGAVIAFELDASRPRIVVNLGQARRQRLQLSSQLLRLVRVIQ